MSAELHLPFENRILASLPAEEYKRLAPSLEPVQLLQGTLLYQAGDAVRHAYFLRSGMASLFSITEDGSTVEVGMVGSEGLVGLPAVLRVNEAPFEVKVQLAAGALRVGREDLRREFNRGGKLQELLLRYTHMLLTQVAQSAACNRFHTAEERLCRWLLVSRDRLRTDTFPLTQESISHMLGVPRTSVSMIASALRRSGLIDYGRGRIEIVDRDSLEAASCECYRVVRDELTHFLAA